MAGKAYEADTRKVLRKLPATVLFIDGNHENFADLNSYAVEQWHGGKVHIIEDDIIHLMRGQVFDIKGKLFFTFGGAYSIEKMNRSEGIDWFPEEMPSREEYQEGMGNLYKYSKVLCALRCKNAISYTNTDRKKKWEKGTN